MNLALDICRGMEYLHSKGVVHLDLAARNCLITADEHGKVRTASASENLLSGNAIKLEPYYQAGTKLPCGLQ